MRTSVHLILIATWVGITVGCAHRAAPSPLRTSAFEPGKPTIPSDPTSPIDRSGVLPLERPNPEGRIAPPDEVQRRTPAGEVNAGSVQHVSPVVRENVASPVERGFDLSSTQPTSRIGASPSSGQYMTLGGVVAEVNSVPIYADKVLGQIAPILAARAKDTTREQFRQIATREIHDQIQALINVELAYAAAQRNLDQKDKDFAEQLTQDWRRHKIAEARSLELARKMAADQGQDFDDMLNEQYRVFMTQIFFQKRLVPRIQVTAEDMRRYYDQHISEFTKPAMARFRLIKITAKQVGDREQALAKIKDLRRRIVDGGEDFASVASTTNDPALLRTGGELNVQKNSFGEPKVEQAVWAAPIGSVTPVIETPDAFYIAKVEEKTEAHTSRFDEEQVQDPIREKLRAEQFNTMYHQALDQLRKQSLIRSDENMMNTAIDMAMENYAVWSQKSSVTK